MCFDRYGEAIWDAERAYKLKYMLESAVQRRFPRGLKMHVQANDRNCLVDLFAQLSTAGFWITRCVGRLVWGGWCGEVGGRGEVERIVRWVGG